MIIKNYRTFHLIGKTTSYVLYMTNGGDLIHYYYGKEIPHRDYSEFPLPESDKWFLFNHATENEQGMGNVAQEYPTFGHNDSRNPAYTVVNADGNAISKLKFKSHKIYEGKYTVDGMPCLFEGDKSVSTLEITMTDEFLGFDVVLYYSVYDEYDIITRSAKIINNSDKPIDVTKIMSMSIDLPVGEYETVHFAGAWARERDLERTEIKKCSSVDLSNIQGTSGHKLNPFVMVCEKGASETKGEVYGFSLIYSGDHQTVASMDAMNRLRVNMGINPMNFKWTLNPDEEIMAPECVLSYSDDGFRTLSHNYHEVYNNILCKSEWSKKDRPILLNNWEGTYFDFNEDKIVEMAKAAKDAGIELFVLDDGWFGKRNDDTCSLGDWYVNKEKLPNGIDGLAKKINDLGLMFGLWFEPEMISPDSDLYRAHPDWAIQIEGREPAQWRNQLILDLSKDEVCEYIIESVSKILESANISYVKWDMNRYLTDRPCLGYSHKYVLGFYKVMDGICSRFPKVLFEGCSAGGGRFDAGVLAYMPQIWTSDNTDAIARLKIQYATSFVYPLSAISAHVAAVPGHQTHRTTSLAARAAVATTGSFGYELDITKMSDEEMAEIKEQIARYKQVRTMMRTGTFYRLVSPFETEYCAWETVSEDKSCAIVMAAKPLYTIQVLPKPLKLVGLKADAMYEWVETGDQFYGAELMNRGLFLEFEDDFDCKSITIRELKMSSPKAVEDRIAEYSKKLESYPKLRQMYDNCYRHTIEKALKKLDDGSYFLLTGDIPAMWLRDSTAQVTHYLPLAKDKEMSEILEGVIRKQFMYIKMDPYANAFNEYASGKGHPNDIPKNDPWIHERKYEIDSLCYPIRLLYMYWKQSGKDDIIKTELEDIVKIIINQWRVEQHHFEKSPYRFTRPDVNPKSPWDSIYNEGMGNPVVYTGMTWSGFRPSDDGCQYGYLIASEMFAVVVLGYMSEMLRAVCKNEELAAECDLLREEIDEGINKYGIVENEKYGKIYACETDGMGNYSMIDDANIPSLLSIPYIGYRDKTDEIYQNTRKFLLSHDNEFYFEGKCGKGIGSRHTPENYVWHMALAMQGITAITAEEKRELLDMICSTDAGTGYLHEGFFVDNPNEFTREWFTWPNSLFAEFVEKCVDEGII